MAWKPSCFSWCVGCKSFFLLTCVAEMWQVRIEQKYVGYIVGTSGSSLNVCSQGYVLLTALTTCPRFYHQESLSADEREAFWMQEKDAIPFTGIWIRHGSLQSYRAKAALWPKHLWAGRVSKRFCWWLLLPSRARHSSLLAWFHQGYSTLHIVGMPEAVQRAKVSCSSLLWILSIHHNHFQLVCSACSFQVWICICVVRLRLTAWWPGAMQESEGKSPDLLEHAVISSELFRLPFI